tara:strand:- start:3766 stop:4239 length:474 start_codon:yes stop_codon:yes gene_type:complete
MRWVFLLFLIITIFSCKERTVFKGDIDIINSSWHTDSVALFEFEVKDTISYFSTELNIRHTVEYPFQNLFIFIKTVTPKGDNIIDTVECILADKNGKWHGRGIGDIVDFSMEFNPSTTFKISGIYKIELEQAMRYSKYSYIEFLEEIVSVGIDVRKK